MLLTTAPFTSSEEICGYLTAFEEICGYRGCTRRAMAGSVVLQQTAIDRPPMRPDST
jgi:hypothetical protein